MKKTATTLPNDRLRQERKLRGWTQRRLAEEIGTSENRISRWEAGAPIRQQFQEKLCALFGKNALELGFLASDASPQDRMREEENQERDRQDMDTSRRKVIDMVASTAITTLFDPSILQRFPLALSKAACVDETVLRYLAAKTASYWRDRNEDALPPMIC